ncbi:hypothetical protein BDN70DRAFT_818808 [Pholiota conissans]|uniref:Uncharacterized protein n=1 Tax=Pholiota conissans TaxID=109636 RepID=A0A9P6CMJ3_9AGAR|nr:hypothetical protein BDN70DRAFT_818808 [Pholiota conissans]
MESLGTGNGLSGRVEPHRRGHFPALNTGILHGIGTKTPVNLNTKKHTCVAEALLARSDVRRLAHFASTSFAGFAPRLYSYYKDHLDPLYDHQPDLKRIFPARLSVFPTAAFNFGPNAWTYKHRDVTNCAFGWCAIQALGDFDAEKGGHLVLWELKLVVEFPAGALVLLPSAVITHSNIPVAEGDKRMSFTQYAPGGLFRYVDHGFRLEKDLKKEDPELYQDVLRLQPKRWEMGLGLLSMVEELQR